MLHYPQLITGSVCQFPIRRRATAKTIVNELADGSRLRMSDPGAASIRWELKYSGLNDDEWRSIREVFAAAEGCLLNFTFLDPTDNLLAWSEDWTKPIWEIDPLLTVGVGVTDILGGNGALQLTNGSQASQRAIQTIAGASWFQYCFSIYARSDASVTIQLIQSTVGQELRKPAFVGPDWSRVVMAGALASNQDGISFGLELPAGAQLEVFGAQVKAQAAAGQYQKTQDRGGVYSKTRFDSDMVSVATGAPNQNSCTVNLIANLT